MLWEDYSGLAKALETRYPNSPIDALSLPRDKLIEMIVSLPCFYDDKNAPDADYHAKFIRSAWVSVRMPETYYINDSAYI